MSVIYAPNVRKATVLGVYRAALEQATVLALAQDGNATAFLWATVPATETTKAARIRSIRVDTQHSSVLATPTAPRLLASRFTFSGTPTGKKLGKAKVDTNFPTPVLDLREAITGLTVTMSVDDGRTAAVTFTDAGDIVNWTGHGLAVGARVVFTNSGGALPTSLTAGTTYFVLATPDADTFTITATPGGAAKTFSGTGTGTHTGTEKLPQVVGLAGIAGALTAVAAYAPVPVDLIGGLEDDWPVIRPGEGIAIYQGTPGTTSDTRKINVSIEWDEVPLE